MNQDTKEYIDKKFADQAAGREAERTTAQNFIASRQKMVKRVVLACAGVMFLLLCAMLYLLYKYQLQGFLR